MTRLRVCAPPLVDPILPLLSRDLPRGADWRYELKLDGGTLYLEKNGARFRSKTGRVPSGAASRTHSGRSGLK